MFAIDPLSCILYGPMHPLFDEGGCGTFATRHQLPPVNGGTVVGFNVVSDYWNLVRTIQGSIGRQQHKLNIIRGALHDLHTQDCAFQVARRA